MTFGLGINSDLSKSVEHTNKGAIFLRGNALIFEAPVLTLNQMLIEASAPSFMDLLSLDVERVKLEILKSVDHSKLDLDTSLLSPANLMN